MNRTRWCVACFLAGLLAISGCSSDDTAPVDTSASGGSDSGADHSASGGAGGIAGSHQGRAGADASAGEAQADSDLPDAPLESSPEGDVARDGTTDVSVGDASDAASDVATETSSACTGDLQCQGGAWRCDLNTHTCVPCLPGVTDNCPAGQYCTTAFSCVAGCKSNAACASGACTNHECERCQNDLECAAGNVCGSGVCAPACTVQGGCGTGFDCCGGHCVSLARDIHHCGGCPNACDLSQFCSSTGCASVSIANICGNASTTMVLNSNAPDNAANAVLQVGLTTNCSPPPTPGQSPQTSPGPINPTTGQPVAGGGNLITVAGGYFVQSLVNYLDQIGATPVYLSRASTTSWSYFRRGGGADAGPDGGASDALVAEIAMTENATLHDIILIETVRDPSSGTLVLIAFGQLAESTAAAARYVANQMLPVANRASYDKSWYVYDWQAASDAGAETFTLKASGP
jgi:hypothetical protein